MNCKRILLLYAAVLILAAAFHVPDTAEAKQQERSILIVYSTLDGKKSADVKMLDLIAGHFTSHVTVVNDADVKAADLAGKDRVIYYGQTKRKLNKKLAQLISSFQKPVTAIGFNAGQFSQFADLSLKSEDNVYQIRSTNEENDTSLESGIRVLKVSGLKGKALYTYKADDGKAHPFVWKTGKSNVYIGLTDLLNNNLLAAKQLRQAFGETPDSTLLYLRLEDISPMSDENCCSKPGLICINEIFLLSFL